MTSKTTGAAPQAAAGGVKASYVGSTGLGIAFTLILAAPVALFFWFAAYSPGSLAGPAGPHGSTSVWIVFGVGLILYATLLNGLYVLITNRAAARAGARAMGTLALLAGAALLSILVAPPAQAAEPGGGPNGIAVSFFVVLVGATGANTWWAARPTRATPDI